MCPADSLYETWRQWRMNGRCACGPISTPSASISSLAPMEAAFFICSTLMLTTANSAWVTTMRSQPASRAASMMARASVGEAWPVQTTSFCWAQTLRTSRTAGSALPSAPTTLTPSGASLKCLTWLSASKVGNHTTRPKPPCMRHIHCTASALMPPDGPLRATPPNALMPGTCLRTSQARSAVSATWFLEDDGFRLAGHVRLRGLVVVDGTAERVRRAVSVEVDQAFDRAHRGRRWREDASLGRCALHL